MGREFLDHVCKFRRLAAPLFAIDVTLFVLLLAVFPFLEQGSATYYVSLLSFAIIGGTIVAWIGLEYVCRQRDREKNDFLEGDSKGE